MNNEVKTLKDIFAEFSAFLNTDEFIRLNELFDTHCVHVNSLEKLISEENEMRTLFTKFKEKYTECRNNASLVYKYHEHEINEYILKRYSVYVNVIPMINEIY